MASSPGTQTLVTQPAFAAQIQSVSSPMGVNVALQRGYMIWGQTMPTLYSGGGPLGDGRDLINFLFNPSTISTDYNIGNATLQAAMMYQQPGDNTNLLAPLLQQTVSFQLYFDRTYELNYGGNSSAVNDPAVIGVQADVYQFMQFTGILASLDASQESTLASTVSSAGGGTATAPTSLSTGGIMMMIPCYVVFGNAFQQMNNNASNSNFSALASQLRFYGYISEWSVQYTHFTENMVPIRCSISVNFTMLPTPATPNSSNVWRNPSQAGNGNVTVPHPAGYTPTPSLLNLTAG